MPADRVKPAGSDPQLRLPLLLVAGPLRRGAIGAALAGAALLAQLRLARPASPSRPGANFIVRRRVVGRALCVCPADSADGFTLGVAPDSGRPAVVSWSEAERGLLVCSGDPDAVTDVAALAVAAGIRLQKSVVILDLAAGTPLANKLTALCQLMGAALYAPPTVRLGGLAAAIGHALRRGDAVLLPPSHSAVAELATVLSRMADLGLRADTLACIHGWQVGDVPGLRQLLALGPATGTSIVLSTESDGAVAAMASAMDVTVAVGPVSQDLAVLFGSQLARCGKTSGLAVAQGLIAQAAGTFALIARSGPSQLTLRCMRIPVQETTGQLVP